MSDQQIKDNPKMLQLDLHFESDPCIIYFNPKLNCVHTVWKGDYSGGQGFHTILNEIVALLEKKKIGLIVADARKMKLISTADQKWIVDDWYPRALKAGFYCQALIVSEATLNEMTIKQIVDVYDENQVRTKYFKSYDDAEAWIIENYVA
jgi:hypothetical protein